MARFGDTQTSQSGAINALADRVNQGESVSTLTSKTDGAATLTVGELINGTMIVSGSPGSFALTYPTPAAIVTAIEGCQVGSAFEFYLINNGDGTITLTDNGLATQEGTATLATSTSQVIRGVVSVVTSGSEAVAMWALLKTAS